MHICCRIHTPFLCSWSNYQSTRNAPFHEWDANKAEWGECICTDESSWCKHNASQSLFSFFYGAGICASHASLFSVSAFTLHIHAYVAEYELMHASVSLLNIHIYTLILLLYICLSVYLSVCASLAYFDIHLMHGYAVPIFFLFWRLIAF